MADKSTLGEELDPVKEKKAIADEKNRLKKEQADQKKSAKSKEKEIKQRQAKLTAEREGNPFTGFLVTLVIIFIWLGILALLVKLDVGGFGSNVLTPILKDVKVVNLILPKSEATLEQEEVSYGGYSSLKDAVEEIKRLEVELQNAQKNSETLTGDAVALHAEIDRLKTFEDSQLEFQRIKTQFAQEVVYAEKGPGADEYRKYYENLDPETAEYIYRQVISNETVSSEVKDYVSTYSAMKADQAAKIFESMTDMNLVANILKEMTAAQRGSILGAMSSEKAAQLTTILYPSGN